MLRLMVLMITLALMTGSAYGAIDQLMRAITGGLGGGARANIPVSVNRRFTVVSPNGELSFGYGYRPGFF
ncbi:ejaculatory bulb-specific protein 2 [Drosophila gunungcola]|uniref:Uncharacterized protein n=1 Tax=Drosophila gunungcola TaxID=103775 RepID=A0A9Q0BIV8_9MUSC|nr:ejaculatory bulb-specific protein 2 [Drosophila elegans]XP_052843712.1 ejaculatory bulb-specific protein 2 [Drosophila gunungcola]KAI8034142.1 hypothetical protein M5D96_013104 [Drosophila gunungcola]